MPDVRKGDTVVVAGTRKGLFVAHSRDRRRWRIRGPYFEGTSVHDAILTKDGRTIHAAVTSDHWGPTVARSASFGSRWSRTADGPRFGEDSGFSVSRVWSLAEDDAGVVYAGVEPAGLFRSADGGRSWEAVDGFNRLDGRGAWQPGGGGLNLHTILPYPGDTRRMLVAASAVGAFGTNDAGATWRLMNGDVRADFLPAKRTAEEEIGSCPHKIVRDARDPSVVYMQNHCGVFRRKRGDAGWTDISRGLPSRFGFPVVAHPHDGGTVYTVPLEGDYNRVVPDGAMALWRTRDAGRTWSRLDRGLPKPAWVTVLRDGLATDGKDPAGLYVGTTGGHLYASRDEGESWAPIAEHLPPVLAVEAGVAK